MDSYASFAFFYDELTNNVNYEKRAEFFLDKLNEIGHLPGLTLDLACGTGSLTLELLKRGIDTFGVDASPQMLSIAKDKAQGFPDVLFVCQKMQRLELYAPVDTVMCMLDGINHLPSFDDMMTTFRKVHEYLNPGGVFIFDMNTVYKHKEILAHNTFVYDMENVFCCWQNSYNDDDSVDISLDFFAKSAAGYKRFTESFTERAYEEQGLKEALLEVGFVEVHIYDSPGEEKERKVVMAIHG